MVAFVWVNLYLVAAVLVSTATWLVSPRFQSYDPPSDFARGFWCVVAGALWPLIVIGAAQLMAVRFVVSRFRSEQVDAADVAPPAALQDA